MTSPLPPTAAASTPAPSVQRRRRPILVVGVVVALVVGAAAWWQWRRGYVVELDQPSLQSWLDGRFPVERSALGIVVKLTDPQVTLIEGSDRLRFGTRAAVSVAGHDVRLGGTVVVSARLRYDASQGALYADDATVESLAIDGLSGTYAGPTTGAAAWAVRQSLAARPVYVLTPRGLGRSLARLLLTDVRVVNGRLRVTLEG